MQKFFVFFVISAVVGLTGCGKDVNNKCLVKNNDLIIGEVLINLPDCYSLFYSDSVNRPSQVHLIKEDSLKLDLIIDGVADYNSLIINGDPDYETVSDTIANNYIRKISTFKKGKGYGFAIVVFDKRMKNTSLQILPTDSVANILIYGYTPSHIVLTENEKTILVNSFSDAKIL